MIRAIHAVCQAGHVGDLVCLSPQCVKRVTLAEGQVNCQDQFKALPGSQSKSKALPVSYWVSGSSSYLSVNGLRRKTIASQDSLLTQALHKIL